jgi:hypothetical protein
MVKVIEQEEKTSCDDQTLQFSNAVVQVEEM